MIDPPEGPIPQAEHRLERIRRGLRWSGLLLIASTLAVTINLALVTSGPSVRGPAAIPAEALPVVPAAPLSLGPAATGSQPPAQPVELAIPSIDVKSPLVDLARRPDGQLPAPSDYQVAGWYAAGPMPGEPGGPPAVIVGHVDSRTGPAVFYRLRDLVVGSDIETRDIVGSIVRFRVYRLSEYPKSGFPSGEVYAPSQRAELRLITCSGAFDEQAGSYKDNLVVYAVVSDGGP